MRDPLEIATEYRCFCKCIYDVKLKNCPECNEKNNHYKGVEGMNFGQALEAMKLGSKVAREGWNGAGMFAALQKGYPDGIPCNKQTAEAWGLNEGDLFKVRPYFQLKTAQNDYAMWVPSGSDILAEDWTVVF